MKPVGLGAVALSTLLGLDFVRANTEKVIFLGPTSLDLPQDGPSIEQLQISSLTPERTSLRVRLPVAFPSDSHPKGLESWYVLHDLEPARRYEVRICWAAIQPTAFDLDVFTLQETFETPKLIQGLARAAEERIVEQDDPTVSKGATPISSPQSLLFLRINSAADYYTMNKTLMQSPPAVLVDIILDPFFLNILPRSLLSTAIYVVIVAIVGWLVSKYIWDRIYEEAAVAKEHNE